MAHTRIWMCESHIESGYKDVRCRSLTCSGIVREPRAHVSIGDMPKSPSSQYGLKAQEDIDPRGIRVTNGPMR